MGTSHRRRRRALGAAVAFCAVMLGTVPSASADSDDYDWAVDFHDGDLTYAPPWDEFFGIIGNLGPVPQQAIDTFRSCPDQATNAIPTVAWCIVFRVTGGAIRLGSTVAHLDPFEVVAAVYAEGDLDHLTPVVITAPTPDAPDAMSLPGGILGMRELDALVNADPLNLLSVRAKPSLGAVGAAGENPAGVLGWAAGDHITSPIVLQVPLNIRLQNLLLGDTCDIGPITLNLTNGQSGGLTGSDGVTRKSTWWESQPQDPFENLPGSFNMSLRVGGQLVDATFDVPGAYGCGPLGIGKAIDDLGLQGLNIVDAVVDSQAGLPGHAGRNYAAFDVDTFVSQYNATGIGSGSWFESLSG